MILVLILLDRDVLRSSSIHDSKTMIWLSWGSVLRKPWSVRKFLLHRVCKCIPPLFLIFDSQSIHGELLRHALDEYSCTVDEYIDDGAGNSDSHHSGWGFLRNLRKSGLFPGNFSVCTPSTLADVVLLAGEGLMWVSASLSLSFPSVHTSPSSSYQCCNSYFSWKSGHGPISSKYKSCEHFLNFANKYFQNLLTIPKIFIIPKSSPYVIAIASSTYTQSFGMPSIHYHSSKHQEVWTRVRWALDQKGKFSKKLRTHFLR